MPLFPSLHKSFSVYESKNQAKTAFVPRVRDCPRITALLMADEVRFNFPVTDAQLKFN
jgi:hypothetical protein